MSDSIDSTISSLVVKFRVDFDPLNLDTPMHTIPVGRPGLRKRSAPATRKVKASASKKPKLDKEPVYDDHTTNSEPEIIPMTTKATRAKGKKVQKTAYYTNATTMKPDPYGMPAVWANIRQQLCETLPNYNAYQSGAHQNNGLLHGFLVDKEVGPLDVFDHQIIITTLGGDRTKDDDGNTIHNVSKDNKAAALAAQRTMEQDHPVLVITGQGNRLCPSKLPHYYNVLAWFKVTDVWRETDKKVWKIRLEKIDLTERSWWAAVGTYPSELSPLMVDYDTPKPMSQICGSCNKSSKHIYNQGWVCLNTNCFQFFKLGDETADISQLQYTEAFLSERTKYNGEEPGPFARPLPTQADLEIAGTTPYDHSFRYGIVCPKCGCCSRRTQWENWVCENTMCDFVHDLNMRNITIHEAMAEEKINMREFEDPSLESRLFTAGKYDVHEYILPGSQGKPAGWVRLFKTNPLINEQPHGPNQLFEQMQKGGFKLSRNPSKCPGSPGEILTSHYASNWGAIYKYGVTPTTTGFNEASPAILRALKRLTWAGKYALGQDMQPFEEFNELLLLGYYEGGKIGYHDDGESTLGPMVATLSLGADATMHFRPKKSSSIGVCSGKGSKATKPDVLRIILNHGDLLVMHGTDIHKEYEHAVKPSGKLRFALTSRYIIPERMQNAADIEFARLGGTLPDGHEQYDYDGDFNAQPVPRTKNKLEILTNIYSSLSREGCISQDEEDALIKSAKQTLS